MKKLTMILISAVMLFSSSCINKNNEISDLRGKVKFETISVSGKLSGRIKDIYVTEGQQVNRGDTLALLDVPELGAKLLQADGAIEAAQGQLEMAYNGATNEQIDQLDSQLESAKSQLNFAKESFNRVNNMYQDSLIATQKFDEAKMKLEMAKAQVNAFEAKRKEIVNGARKEIIAQAKGQLSRAEGAKSEVLIAEDEKYLIAPVNMSIETITLHKGELATPGYTIFNGYETNNVFFRFTVSESKVYNYKLGQRLIVYNPYTKEEIPSNIIAVNQLARYADITSTSPLYKLSEAIYELKLIPVQKESLENLYINSTVLIK